MLSQQFDIFTVDELFDQLKLFILTTVKGREVRRLSDQDIIFEAECFLRLKLDKREGFSSIAIEVGSDLEEISSRAVDGEETFPFRTSAGALVRLDLEFEQEMNSARVFLIGDFPKSYRMYLDLKAPSKTVQIRNHSPSTSGEFMKCGG